MYRAGRAPSDDDDDIVDPDQYEYSTAEGEEQKALMEMEGWVEYASDPATPPNDIIVYHMRRPVLGNGGSDDPNEVEESDGEDFRAILVGVTGDEEQERTIESAERVGERIDNNTPYTKTPAMEPESWTKQKRETTSAYTVSANSSRGGGIDTDPDIHPTGTFKTHAWVRASSVVETETKKTYLVVKDESSADNSGTVTTVLGTVVFTLAENSSVSTSVSYEGDHHSIVKAVGGCVQLTAETPSGPGWVTVRLVAVGIVATEHGEQDPPEDGLLVKKGDKFDLRLSDTPQDEFPIEKGKIIWQLRIMMNDGAFGPWVDSPLRGVKATGEVVNAGIFQVRAKIQTSSGDTFVEFLRSKDEKEGGEVTRTVAGELDAIGFVETEIQKEIVRKAKAALGDTTYAESKDFPPIPEAEPKCNLFVAHKAESAGANVPWINGWPWKRYPPVANQWAGTQKEEDGSVKSIPDWNISGSYPQPGWIVAFPRKSGSGHVGILDYDGVGIAAGTYEVNKRFDFYSTTGVKDGATRYRNYTP